MSVKRSTFLAVAIPTIAGNALSSFVRFASIKAVGSLGVGTIAVVIASERALVCIQCVLAISIAATTTLVAQYVGANDDRGVVRSLKTCLLIATVLALAATIATWMLAPVIMGLLGVAPALMQTGISFLVILSAFNVPYAIGQVMAAALRSAGDGRSPLGAFAVANILNICLLFVFVRGTPINAPFGAAGAAWANGISYLVAAIVLIAPWLLGSSRLPSKVDEGSHDNKVGIRLATRIAEIGVPAALEQLVFQAGLMIMLFIVSRFGAAALAAYGVGINLISLSYIFGYGFSTALATVVGQHIGGNEALHARKRAWSGSVYAVFCMTVMGIALFLGADWISKLLSLGPEAGGILKLFLLFLAIVQPAMALEFSLQGALQGAGKTRTVLFITIAGLVFGRLILAVTFLQMGLGLPWIFGTMIADYGLKGVLYIAAIRSKSWTEPVLA